MPMGKNEAELVVRPRGNCPRGHDAKFKFGITALGWLHNVYHLGAAAVASIEHAVDMDVMRRPPASACPHLDTRFDAPAEPLARKAARKRG
jgi:hypothetical protein